MMRTLLFSALLAMSAVSHAQFEGMSNEDLSRLMGNAGQLMACFGQLDQSRLEALGNRVESIGAELEQLCESGQRAEAQRRARGYADELMAEPEYQALLECGEMAQQMFPDLVDLSDLAFDDESTHICDEL